jgi:hypothetical protein
MATPEILEIRFDEQGQIDRDGERALTAVLDGQKPSDLFVFSHGWNNTPSVARRLYEAFFERVGSVLAAHGVPGRRVAYLGVFWPSMRWTDEPIPDFAPGDVVDLGAGAGPAADFRPAGTFDPPPPPDAKLRAQISAAFPGDVKDSVTELLGLLETRPDDKKALERARELVRTIAAAAGPAGDGEQDARPPFAAEPDPADALFTDFAAALEELNIDTGDSGGAAGIGDQFQRLWHGAQEVARGLTYWQMKNRAGVVGENGLGPLVGRLKSRYPGMKINLIGHSFGGRVVSYTLKGVSTSPGAAAPVQSVTLLQAAFSHFAFAAQLPMVQKPGALADQQSKVAGPVTACYSVFDSAVGTLYPLASLLKGDDASAVDNPLYRFGGMGHDGHQQGVLELSMLAAGERYDFGGHHLVNIDAQRVVRNGKPPSGAHSDIVHDELAWVAVCAAGLAGGG